MKDALNQLGMSVQKGPASDLISVLFGEKQPTVLKQAPQFTPFNKNLDDSQVTLSFFSFLIKPPIYG
jgi:ATP-dependent RNA/DNA helicase IGHMBP2